MKTLTALLLFVLAGCSSTFPSRSCFAWALAQNAACRLCAAVNNDCPVPPEPETPSDIETVDDTTEPAAEEPASNPVESEPS
jgi:hypothetical protein